MEGIFFIKWVGTPTSIEVKGEQLAKLSIVISNRLPRSGDNGVYK